MRNHQRTIVPIAAGILTFVIALVLAGRVIEAVTVGALVTIVTQLVIGLLPKGTDEELR